MPTLEGGRLLAERKTMRVFRWAMIQVLLVRPVTESPNMDALYPSARNLYAAIMEHRDTLEHDDPLSVNFDNITQFVRTSPDVSAFTAFLGVDEAWVDQVFRDAMAIEATIP